MERSPFPGMDPYLEQTWRDVHQRLITYTSDAIQPGLGPGLRARVEERVLVQAPPEDLSVRSYYPDIHVYQKPTSGAFLPPAPGSFNPGAADDDDGATGGVAVAEPIIVEMVEPENPTEGFIQILDAQSGGQIITVIEYLSPSNKEPGPAREQYRRKREDYRRGRVSLVEIDLVRAGDRDFTGEPRYAEASREVAYAAFIRRGWEKKNFELYPIPLHNRLPLLRIPLRQGEPGVLLDVQAVLNQAYRNARYGEDLDYTKPPPGPPLMLTDAAWTDGLLRGAGLRRPS